jgi:hypothetical protein
VLAGAVLAGGFGLDGVPVALGAVVPGCDGAALADGVAVGDAPGCDVLPHAAVAASTTTAKTTDRRDERIAPAPCDKLPLSCWRYEQ